MSAHEVHFILDPHYAGDLWELSRRAHVWICNSASNDGLIREVWAAETEAYSPLLGVSSFELGADVLATLYAFLGTIDAHHDEVSGPSSWSAIHVVGLPAQLVSAERILAETSAEGIAIAPRENGFTIRRSD